MSAACEKCGTNLVYRWSGRWPDEMFCRPCEFEAQLAEAQATIQRLHEELRALKGEIGDNTSRDNELAPASG